MGGPDAKNSKLQVTKNRCEGAGGGGEVVAKAVELRSEK